MFTYSINYKIFLVYSFIFQILYVHALLLWSHLSTPYSFPFHFFEESKVEMLVSCDACVIGFFLKKIKEPRLKKHNLFQLNGKFWITNVCVHIIYT